MRTEKRARFAAAHGKTKTLIDCFLYINNMKNQDSSELDHFLKGIRDSFLVLLLVGLCLTILYSFYY